MRPLIGLRTETVATVAATVDTYLGLGAYADIDYLSRLIGEESAGNVLLGHSPNPESLSGFLAEVKTRPTVVGVDERAKIVAQMRETFLESTGATISIMVLFAGLIAFGSVLNAALVSLSEREREVATFRVLGFTPGQIDGIFRGESFLISSVAIALGLVAGIGLAHVISMAYDTELYRFPTVILPSRLVQSALLSALFVGLAQLVSYRAIKKLNWLDIVKVRE